MIRSSEQARDLAVDVDVHVLGSRMLRQARHRQDVARQGDDEAGAALTRSSLTVMRKPVGRPIFVASSESEYCVLAMQTGILSKPSSSISLSCFLAAGVKSTPSPP